MIYYVVGFAFDEQGSVALIQKKRPAWQQGRWNGIGGHIEQDESGAAAMAREFTEETGMPNGPDQWRFAGTLLKMGVFRCSVFTATFPELRVNTVTDETVRVFKHQEIPLLGGEQYPSVSNIPALLALVQMPPDSHGGDIPVFSLAYK